MICPTCGHDNLPGSEHCYNCMHDLTSLDRPIAHDRVEQSLIRDHVSVLSPQLPAQLAPDDPLATAIQEMLNRNTGAVLVVSPTGSLLGILTERDLLTKVAGLIEDYAHLPVKDFMTTRPETVQLDNTLDFALHKMDGGGYRHLPVLDGETPVGMISVRDMLRHITRLCQGS